MTLTNGIFFMRLAALGMLVLITGCVDTPPYYPGHGDIRKVSCASDDEGYRRCGVPGRVVEVHVRERLSVADCERGQGWGWSRHEVWVDRGCRAVFDVVTE